MSVGREVTDEQMAGPPGFTWLGHVEHACVCDECGALVADTPLRPDAWFQHSRFHEWIERIDAALASGERERP